MENYFIDWEIIERQPLTEDAFLDQVWERLEPIEENFQLDMENDTCPVTKRKFELNDEIILCLDGMVFSDLDAVAHYWLEKFSKGEVDLRV